MDGRGRAAETGTVGMTLRVLVADDQDLVRTGLAMILDAQPGIEVVAEATDGREAVELAHRLRPDVCLLDISMPKMDGIEATRALAGPDVDDPIPVVIITTFDRDEYVYGALKAGARGFLLKDADQELLVQAIEAAASGDALVAPNITARLLEAFAATGRSIAPPQPASPHRTGRGGARRGRPRQDQCRDRRGPLHQQQHGQDPHRQVDDQTRCPESGGDRDLGLRDRTGRPYQRSLPRPIPQRLRRLTTQRRYETAEGTSIAQPRPSAGKRSDAHRRDRHRRPDHPQARNGHGHETDVDLSLRKTRSSTGWSTESSPRSSDPRPTKTGWMHSDNVAYRPEQP